MWDWWEPLLYPLVFKLSLGRMRSVYSKSRDILEPKPIFRKRLEQFSCRPQKLFEFRKHYCVLDSCVKKGILHLLWVRNRGAFDLVESVSCASLPKMFSKHKCQSPLYRSPSCSTVRFHCGNFGLWYYVRHEMCAMRYAVWLGYEVCETRHFLWDLQYDECGTRYTVQDIWGIR